MADTAPSPPLPVPTPTSAPFWEGLRAGEVRLQRCEECSTWVYYPRSHCPRCLSPRLSWHAVSGRGRVYTFTIARQATSAHFATQVPQLLGVVELDEGPRLTTTFVDVDPDGLRVGLEVEPVFDALDADHTLLRYRPA